MKIPNYIIRNLQDIHRMALNIEKMKINLGYPVTNKDESLPLTEKEIVQNLQKHYKIG